MANPVVNIGTPGTSQYRVDWGPRQRDQAMGIQGIQDLFGGIAAFEQNRQDARHTATLAELAQAKLDHPEFVDRARAAGVPTKLIGEALTNRRALLPPPRKTAKDAYGRLRYLDDQSFAFPDMADYEKDARTNEQKNLDRYMERNPGKTAADYFAMKRAPGVVVNAGNLTEYRKRFGSDPPANHIWTGNMVPNPAGQMIPELVPVGETARKIAAGEAEGGGESRGRRAARKHRESACRRNSEGGRGRVVLRARYRDGRLAYGERPGQRRP